MGDFSNKGRGELRTIGQVDNRRVDDNSVNERMVRRVMRAAQLAGYLAALIGLAGLLGAYLHIMHLRAIFPGLVAIKVNTCIVLLLLAGSLLLHIQLTPRFRTRWAQPIAGIAGALAMVTGLASFSEAVVGWNLGIDQLLVAEPLEEAAASLRPGLMSPLTAICFVLLGLAVTMLSRTSRQSAWAVQLASLVSATVATIGLMAMLFDVRAEYSHIAIPTLVGLLLLSAAILALRTEAGIGALIVSNGPAGSMFRMAFPVAFFAPILFGWLNFTGHRAGLFSGPLAASFVVAMRIAAVSALLLWAGLIAERSEHRRRSEAAARIKVSEALRSSERRFRSLATATTQIVWSTNAAGEVVGDVPSLRKFTGMSIAAVQGAGWIESLHPEDRARTTAVWANAVKHRILYETEYRMRRHDGEYRWMAVRGAPVLDDAGALREWVGTCTDITDHKIAEQELRLHAAAIENAANAILITDRQGTIVWVNEAFTKLSGYATEEVLGENPRLLQSGELGQSHYKQMWETILAGQTWKGDFVNRRKDGTLFYDETTITPVRSESGTITHFVGIKTDVTERKRAEEALWAANENLNQLLEHSPAVLYRLKVDGEDLVPLMVSGNVTRFCGFAVAETLQYSWWIEHLHPEDRDRAIASERATLDLEENRYEYRLRHKDGSYRWVEDNERLVRGTRGQPSEIVGVWTDITERKRAEEALLHSAEKYRDLFENASYGIYRSMPDGQILDANPALVEMLGYASKEDLLKMNLGTEIYAGPQRRAEFLKRHHADGSRVVAEEEFRCKGGQVIKVRLNGREVRNAAGEFQCYETIAEDVTAQRNLEEQLRHIQKMEAVGQLSGGVAHDFNNLLNVIMGYTQLALEQTAPDDKRHRQLGQVLTASERATSLTRQLLAFSRKQVLEPRLITLNSAMDEAEQMLRRLIGEDIRLVLRPTTHPDRVKVDPGQMSQVIINLAVNARDAMLGGGTLSIETDVSELDEFYCSLHSELTPGRYAMLAVSDTGCGMDPEVKSRIFEPFFTTKPKGKGTGLGLATVYGIVKQSGGHIAVYSELGKGTSFKIYFPSVQGVAAVPSHVARVATCQGGNETVLVVEDDEALREFASEQLSRLGYQVLSAGRGDEALSIVQREPIDLLLTDVVMPGMNGRQLAERIALLQPAVRTLYVSGYTENAITHDGVLDPGIAFLGKPYQAADLARRVRKLLDDRQKRPAASVIPASVSAGQSASGTD